MNVQLGSTPLAAQFGGWRPAPQQAPTFRPRALGQVQWRPHQLGQVASAAKGADVLFSLISSTGALIVGIAAMTVGIGGDPKAVPAKPAVSAWKVVGGVTAALGAAMILINVAKISRFTELAPVSTTPTAQP